MASNFASVKLNSSLVDDARREAETFQRSLGGQIEYWARLGRALENARGFHLDRVRAALNGALQIDDLPEAEQDALFANLGVAFDAPTPKVMAEYGALANQRKAAQAQRRAAPAPQRKAG